MPIYTILSNIHLIAIAILGLGFLIVFHELGHFLFCKLFGVHTPSFSIGFGPRLYEKKIGDTVFAISAIPLGGYVEVAGAQEVGQGEQSHAQDKGPGSFESISYWKKLAIISGGILFNIIFTYFAFVALISSGTPCIGLLCKKFETEPLYIGSVTPDSPAAKSGIKPGDKLIQVDNLAPVTLITNREELAGKTVSLDIDRNGQSEKVQVELGTKTVGKKNYAQLGATLNAAPKPLAESLVLAWHATKDMFLQIFVALKDLFKSRENLGGPLMIISQARDAAAMGWKSFLFILALISINLAAFNIIPLPIFDGGQALFYTIEAILRRPLSESTRYKIHYATWIGVILLVIYLTFNDLTRIFFRQ